jgi:hypothetical protein
MENQQTWGKAEVEALIQKEKDSGNYMLAQEIKMTIKKQDPELVIHEHRLINYGIMIFTALAGYLARKSTTSFLEKHFA